MGGGLKSGRLEAFRLDTVTGSVEPWLVVPDELPAGAPPLVVSDGEGLRLAVPPAAHSALTHPVPLGPRLLGVAGDGRLFVAPGGEQLPVLALPDARVTRGGGGTLAVLSDPTGRYDHGVLGDDLEAGSITVLEPGIEGPEVVGEVRPLSGGVFESLAPMWFEAEPDDGGELLAVTESTADGGPGSRPTGRTARSRRPARLRGSPCGGATFSPRGRSAPGARSRSRPPVPPT